MFKCLEDLIDREEYLVEFKTKVLFDIYNFNMRIGLRRDEPPYRPDYEREAQYMTKVTNNLHYKLVDGRDFAKMRKETIENAGSRLYTNISLNTIFNYLDTSHYRFENYFDDYRMIYPFESKQSESHFEFMDELAKNIVEGNNIPPYRQVGLIFSNSIRYLFKKMNVEDGSNLWAVLTEDILSLSDRGFRRALTYGDSIGIDHVLKASYHFQIHPYQLMGLRRLDYHRLMD